MSISNRSSILSAAAAVLLSGCTSLAALNTASESTDLYSLTPKSTFDPNLPRLSQQIIVDTPTATASVDTDQVAIHPTPLQVQYLPGVRWVDRAPLIIQALLIESFENSGKVGAVGRSAVGLRPDFLIVTDVREFQAQIPAGEDAASALEVWVRLNVKVVDADEGRIVGSKSFSQIRPTASDDMMDISVSFDLALGSAMRDAVEWSIRTMHSQVSG